MTRGQESAQYRIAPLATFADQAALSKWVDAAAAGHSAVYATGPALPQKHPVIQMVSVLADRGVVRPHVVRRADGRGFDFLIVKRGAGAVSDDMPSRRDDREARTDRVLEALTQRAETGSVMQSNLELARECGLKNADEASYQLRKLIQRGVIRIEDFGPNERRCVTIIAIGKTTVRGRL